MKTEVKADYLSEVPSVNFSIKHEQKTYVYSILGRQNMATRAEKLLFVNGAHEACERIANVLEEVIGIQRVEHEEDGVK